MKKATVTVAGIEREVAYPVWSGILSKRKYGFKPLEFLMTKFNGQDANGFELDEEELLLLLWAGLLWKEPELELQTLGEQVEYAELINAAQEMITVIIDTDKVKKSQA